jgi:hypothetical protein
VANGDDRNPLRTIMVGVAVAVTASAIVGAGTAAAGAFIAEARLEVRVDQIEKTAASPATIATMQGKLDRVADEVAGLSRKIDELTATQRKPTR